MWYQRLVAHLCDSLLMFFHNFKNPNSIPNLINPHWRTLILKLGFMDQSFHSSITEPNLHPTSLMALTHYEPISGTASHLSPLVHLCHWLCLQRWRGWPWPWCGTVVHATRCWCDAMVRASVRVVGFCTQWFVAATRRFLDPWRHGGSWLRVTGGCDEGD